MRTVLLGTEVLLRKALHHGASPKFSPHRPRKMFLPRALTTPDGQIWRPFLSLSRTSDSGTILLLQALTSLSFWEASSSHFPPLQPLPSPLPLSSGITGALAPAHLHTLPGQPHPLCYPPQAEPRPERVNTVPLRPPSTTSQLGRL